MTKEKANKLREWYNLELDRLQSSGEVFNFKLELIKYCYMDVKVLLQSVMEFGKLLQEIAGVYPYSRCFTLASLAMEVFRTKFLQENTIGITPVNGYKDAKESSKCGTSWLLAIEKIRQITEPNFKIEREQKVGKYYVDGIHRDSRTIYQYDGCYFHGCDICYAGRMSELGRNGKKHQENNNLVKERNSLFTKLGFTVVVNTDCKLKENLRSDAEFKRL